MRVPQLLAVLALIVIGPLGGGCASTNMSGFSSYDEAKAAPLLDCDQIAAGGNPFQGGRTLGDGVAKLQQCRLPIPDNAASLYMASKGLPDSTVAPATGYYAHGPAPTCAEMTAGVNPYRGLPVGQPTMARDDLAHHCGLNLQLKDAVELLRIHNQAWLTERHNQCVASKHPNNCPINGSN